MKTVVVKRCQVEGTRPQQASEPISSLDLVPRLWPSLPPPIQQQLAQQMAQLIQRLRSPPNLTEGRDVEHLTGG
jgi:hypothetical protein